MNNLTLGMFNSFTASLVNTVPYVNNIGSEDYQIMELRPIDANKWPVDIGTYFSEHPCYMYMTLFDPSTQTSAVYVMLFDNTLAVTPEGVVSVRTILNEQPALDRDISALEFWPSGTLVSNTANTQNILAGTHAFENALQEVNTELEGMTETIGVVSLRTTNNTSLISRNEQLIIELNGNVNALKAYAENNTVDLNAIRDSIDVNSNDILSIENMFAVDAGTPARIPLTNANGQLDIAFTPIDNETIVRTHDDTLAVKAYGPEDFSEGHEYTQEESKLPANLGALSKAGGGFFAGMVVAFTGSFGGPNNKHPIPNGQTEPDLTWQLHEPSRGKFILGGTGQNQGVEGGSESTEPWTLTTAQMPSHSHSRLLYPAATHSMDSGKFGGGTGGAYGSGAVDVTGTSQPHSHRQNLPPYYTLAYIEKLPS